MVAAATVLSGALLALSEGSGAPRAVQAVERLSAASLRVDESQVSVAEVPVTEVPVAEVPVVGVLGRAVAATTLDSELAATPRAHLLVLDVETGLGVRQVTVTTQGRVERFDPIHGQPITLKLDAPDQRLEVGAPGYLPHRLTVQGDGPQEVHLTRSTTLRGVVRDAFGAPMPHACVRLLASASEGAGGDGPRRATLRRTDIDGAFTFEGLEPGTYRTSVDVAGERHLSRPLELHEGEWAQADHRLATSTALSVQVDTPGGLPVDRARLLIQRDGGAAPITRYTDDRGRAAVRPLPAGSYELTIQSAEGTSPPHTFTIEKAGQSLVDLHVELSPAPHGPSD